MIKVLYYNWTPLDSQSVGGGVAVYLKNLLNWICDHPDCGITPVFLSSGYYYDRERKSYLRREKDYRGIPTYTIVNSPVIAPMTLAMAEVESILTEKETLPLFEKIVQQEGPFDVIHFESLEGISPNVLSLKEKYPQMRFVHSIHDYGIVCPRVRLWTNDNRNCYSFSKEERKCTRCAELQKTPCARYYKHRRPSSNSVFPTLSFCQRLQDKLLSILKRMTHVVRPSADSVIAAYRSANVNAINRWSDAELCVSKRVAEIVNYFGVNNEKLYVDYIGTKVAETASYICRTDIHTPLFTILYMGYATQDKGFHFLLGALEKMDKKYSKSIVVKIASKIYDKEIEQRIENLKIRYNKVIVYDGYSHSDFPEIMSDVNIGIVPPQWEDNLPQVSIEMISNGIPVMTSLYGGAHELNSHSDYSFRNEEELTQKIVKIVDNRQLLSDYWNYSERLTTMVMHIDNLLKIYKAE